MNQHLELFQTEIEDYVEAENPQSVSGKRIPSSAKILGRCVRCGSHIEDNTGFCSDCLGTESCNCHSCAQIASLHAMLCNDLYWLKRSLMDRGLEVWLSRAYEEGKSETYIRNGLERAETARQRDIYRVSEDVVKYRQMPRIIKTHYGENWKTGEKCCLDEELKQHERIFTCPPSASVFFVEESKDSEVAK